MPATECLISQRERAPIETLRLGIGSLNAVKARQAVQHINVQAVYVLRPGGTLYDLQRPQVEAFCLRVALLLLAGATECVDDVGNIGVIRPKLGFENLERLQAQRTSACVLPLPAIMGRLVVKPDAQCHGITFLTFRTQKGRRKDDTPSTAERHDRPSA